MRTLHADLVAAQQQPTRRPVVDVRVRNLVSGIERLDFVELSVDPTLGDRHGAAVTAIGTDTNNLLRARASGGTISYNLVVDPTDASNFSSWITLATGMGGLCDAGAAGIVAAVAYVNSAGTGIRVRRSLNAGGTWETEESLATAGSAVLDLAVAVAPDGRIAVAWLTATQRHIIIGTSGGSWGSVSSDTPSGSPTLARLAMTYGFDWNMVITGADSAGRKTLWTALHGDGADFTAGSWSTLRVQQQAEDDADVDYTAPFLMFVDTFRMTYVEEQTFTGGQTRVLRSWLHQSQSFLAGDFTWTSPTPTDVVDERGLALAAGAGHAYECNPTFVRQAVRETLILDVGAAVRALELNERPHDYAGHIDLDNTDGHFAGPPAAIRPGNFVEVALGYETASGPRSSFLPDLNVTGWEYRREGGVAVFRLLVGSGWDQLRRSRQRAQIVHDANVTWVAVLLRIFLRAGLALSSVSASARALAVQPRFTIHPSTSGYDAVRRAQDFIADHIRMAGLTAAQMVDPDPAESPVYEYGGGHPLQAYRLLETPPRIADVHVFADGAFGAAVDPDAAQHALGTRADLRDFSASTGAAAAETAEAHLRRRALDAPAGQLVAQPNVGLQLFDVVAIAADELVHDSPVARRVSAIAWEYRRTPRAVYRQTVELAPV